jgi:hypothetical protein
VVREFRQGRRVKPTQRSTAGIARVGLRVIERRVAALGAVEADHNDHALGGHTWHDSTAGCAWRSRTHRNDALLADRDVASS